MEVFASNTKTYFCHSVAHYCTNVKYSSFWLLHTALQREEIHVRGHKARGAASQVMMKQSQLHIEHS